MFVLSEKHTDTHTARDARAEPRKRAAAMKTMKRVALIAAACCVTAAAMTVAKTDDYVSIIITSREFSDVMIVSIDLDDSRVARAVFAMSDIADHYDAVPVIKINTLTRVIADTDLATVCRELDVTDAECFA